MEENILKVILDENKIKEICKELGDKLTKDYEGKKPIVVGLLKGCHPFLDDLVRQIKCELYIDYMSVSSYSGDSSTGSIKIKKDIDVDVENRHVLIVDDIIDTGLTLKEITKLFKSKNCKSVKSCVLLDKPEGRTVKHEADYVGMRIPKEYVVGYGFDFDGYYRNLPYVGVLKPSAYEK